MNTLIRLLNEPAMQRLGWVLIHFLWQGAVIGLVMVVAMRVMARASAQARYVVLCAGLLACAAAPVITWVVVARDTAPAVAASAGVADFGLSPAPVAETNLHGGSDGAQVPVSPAPASAVVIPATATTKAATPWRVVVMQALDRVSPYAVPFWLAGVIALTLRLVFGWAQLRRLRRSGEAVADSAWEERLRALAGRMGVNKAIRLLHSSLVEVPTLIGWLRPVILLPASAFTGLAPEQLEAILAHELAHVRRCDYLVNLLQAVIETTLFYNPAVWWISRRIREERENCCDDIAVATVRDRAIYAGALAALEESRALPRLALAASDGPLLERIRRIAGVKGGRNPSAPVVAATLIAGVLLVTFGGRIMHGELPADEKQIVEAVKKDDAVVLEKLLERGGIDLNKIEIETSPLLFSARSLNAVEVLLKHGADPNGKDANGTPVLANFCGGGLKDETAIVRALLKAGADPNARHGENDMTALMGEGSADVVDALAEYGADLNAKDKRGVNAIVYIGEYAVANGGSNVGALEAMLRHGVKFDPKTDGATMLVHAGRDNNVATAKWLVAHGVDPNAQGMFAFHGDDTIDYEKPLAMAALQGGPEIVSFLLEHGAKDDKAMVIALHNGRTETLKVLWDHGVRDISELAYAVSQGAPVANLKKLLDAGSPADPAQDAIITPLGVACKLGRMDVVELLVERGADVNKGKSVKPEYPDFAQTPLARAASEGYDEIVEYLLKHGAKAGFAAIYEAIYNSKPYDYQRSRDHFERAAKLLIDAGALKGLTGEQDGYILTAAIGPRSGQGANENMVKALLAAGVSPESPMPLLKKGESNTVIGFLRDSYNKRKASKFSYEVEEADKLKPMLDLLEKADAGKAPTPGGSGGTQDSALERQIGDAVQKDDAAALGKLLENKGVDVNQICIKQALLLFAKSAKVEEMLIEHGADPNGIVSTEESPLLHACAVGAPVEIVRVLLKHGANPNYAWGDFKETPLMLAKDANTVDALVEYGADLYAHDAWSMSVLEKAGRYNGLAAMQAIMAHGVPFDAKGIGPGILVCAAANNDLRTAQWLLEHGVDPDAPASVDEGRKALWYYMATPLGFAALNDHKEMIDLLLKHGADGNKAIHYAMDCLNNETKIVKGLWEHGVRGNVSELCYAVSQGALTDELQKLIDKGAAVNAGEDENWPHALEKATQLAWGIAPPKGLDERSPLEEAAQLGRLDLVEFLVNHGAEVDHSGALAAAAEEVHVDIVDYLLKHGAKPDRWAMQSAVLHMGSSEDPEWTIRAEPIVKMLVNAGGLKTLTPAQGGFILHAALDASNGVGGDPGIVETLLDGGLSPELPLGNGTTVISWFRDDARENPGDQNKELLDLLEKADAALPHGSAATPQGAAKPESPEAIKADLARALQAAVKKGDATAVEKLLEAGADPNRSAPQSYGSALYWALLGGRADVVAVLLKHGANPNAAPPESGNPTLCSLAIRVGKTDIARLLHDAGAKVSPAAWAGMNGDIPALKALVEKGVFKHGVQEAIEPAVAAGELDAVKYLESLEGGTKAFVYLPRAAGAGRTAMMEYLFSGDATMDQDIENAALHAALFRDQTEALKVLFAHGVHANYRPRMEGVIPTNIFCFAKSGTAVKLLLDAGADPNFLAPGDVLSYAPDAESVRLLIQHGVSPKAKRGDGVSAVEWAVLIGRPPEVIDALIEAGVEFDPDKNGTAALCLAAAANNTALVDDLLRHGVNPSSFRPENIPHGGFTPLGLAARDNSADAVRLLLAHGANPAGDPREACSPLASAVKNGRPEIAGMLRAAGAR